MPEVIIVDKKDNEIGITEKMAAHLEEKLHRAFSILIFNSKGEFLLQKRAKDKYHSGGLWSNTCCSHPRPNQDIKDEAIRRLKEEMGIELNKENLKEVFSFIYKEKFGNLTEYEFDHVFLGKFDGNPKPDKEEAEDWKWITPEELIKDVKENPEKYTSWFEIILDKIFKEKKNK